MLTDAVCLLVTGLLLGVVHSKSTCKLPNTGTVLFRNIDTHRKCWNADDLALLYTRRAMMDLIPRQIPHNTPLILEYIQICLTTLREQVTDKEVYDYMFAALVDTFGGYLQTYGLPLMHEAYYEGYVSYDTAAEFHRLQDNFKDVLMTNGEGWTAAMEVRKSLNRILPLKIPTHITTHPCSLMVKYSEHQISDNVSLIPLPFLDDNKEPNSIAIPFKHRFLYNLKSRSSYDILVKYYIESSRCTAQFEDQDKNQLEFDKAFSDWLNKKIVPHLKENVWFVGFSNVLRVIETIQQKGGLVGEAHVEEKEKEEEPVFSKSQNELQLNIIAYSFACLIIVILLLFFYLLFYPLCCAVRKDNSTTGYSSADDEKDSTSLLNEFSKLSRNYGRKKKQCPHGFVSPDSMEDESMNSRSSSEQSRLTLSRGENCSKDHERN